MAVFRQDTQTAAGESIGFGLGKISYELESMARLTRKKPIVKTQGR